MCPTSIKGGKMPTAERRDAERQPFICSAELIEIGGSARIAARTSDLSATGCYIDTLNPFPVGTQVRLRLTKTDRQVEFQARVTSCHRGSGMGLLFEDLTPEQRGVLLSWLQERSAPGESPFRAIAQPQSPSPTTAANIRFAMRLLKILERKGVLTHSEAAELLRDLSS
jgi:hypothetical protein